MSWQPAGLSGRVALVTGGSQGIGLSIVQALSDAGAQVHVFDLAPGDLPDPAVYHQVNIADPQSVADAVESLPAETEFLVNNAGITRDRSLGRMSVDEWQSVIDINLSGAFYLIRAMTPRFKALGRGRVVNITSINGLRGKFGQANYTAAKAGLIGLTKTAARELGPKGVTVNAVAPGMVLTELTRELPREILQKALDETQLKRLAESEDIANAVLFLLSDAARMITGEVLRVDAGQYL